MATDFKFQETNEDVNSENDVYPSVKKALTKIAEKEGYIRHNIYKKVIAADGGNCFGILYEINIEGETIDGNKKKTNLFVKQVIPNGDDIKLLSVSEIFNKEIFVYTELAKMFTMLQDKAQIPMQKRFRLGKIYNEGKNNSAIILENLSKQGFKTYSKTDIMNFSYAKLCLELLAKFHGLGFLIEREMPEYFNNKIKPIKQSIAIDTRYEVFANKLFKLATRKLTPDLKFKIDQWWEIALDDYSKYMKGTMTKVKCLCHGDFKTNNVMYKEIEGTITEVIAVDYQLAHYGSPVLDLIYFIFMGTDQSFRKKHLSQLKDYYYLSLTKYLGYFDIFVDDVYPRKTFEKDFEDSIDYGLVSSICVLPFSLAAENDGVPDLVDDSIVRIGLKFDNRYYDRLKDLFEDFFKWDM